MMEPSPRDLLIDQVRQGGMTPTDAEAEAIRLGLRPLREEPDPTLFDPMGEVWWSLPMAIAWIAWRTADEVRYQWDMYQAERWMWSACRWTRSPGEPVFEGFDLVRAPRATWSKLALACVVGDEYDQLITARASLWKALSEGGLVANGLDLSSRSRVDIPAVRWSDLVWYEENGENVLRNDPTGYAGFRDVHLSAEAVQSAFPVRRPPIERLLPTPAPVGAGYMPLSAAVQWIASGGGNISVGLSDKEVWDGAFGQLLAEIASETITTTGIQVGRRSRMDGVLFAGIQIEHLFESESFDLWGSKRLYLSASPYVDDKQWEHFNDKIRNRFSDAWTHIMVLKSDVARVWPFGLSATERGLGSVKSGSPGKPTSMHLVRAEFHRRCERGIAKTRLSDEAIELQVWLARDHPQSPQLTVKTIKNRLRPDHLQKFGPARN